MIIKIKNTFNFSNDPKVFKSSMEYLMEGEQPPSKCIAPKWYENYRDYHIENKEIK